MNGKVLGLLTKWFFYFLLLQPYFVLKLKNVCYPNWYCNLNSIQLIIEDFNIFIHKYR